MRAAPLLLLPALLAGCDDIQLSGVTPVDPPEAESDDTPPTDAWTPATRADLRMKRWRQISQDLSGALQLQTDELCREAGNFDCNEIHVVPMGGISVDNGLYAPIDGVSVTTGLAIERVLLSACWTRLERDMAGEQPAVVFTQIPLEDTTLDDTAADAQATLLWQRLLARDPSPDELAAARGLHVGIIEDGGRNAEWALSLCVALGTSSEFLLY
jgi:hypothetical protein